MDYIKYIREMVGSKPIIMTAAGVIVKNDKNQIMMQLRADNKKWGIPGGAIELGETFEEAATRELLEETGLKAHKLKLINVYSGEKLYNKYPNGDEVYVAAAIFLCEEYSGNIILQVEETEKVEFFDLDKIPEEKYINPPDIAIINDIISNIKKGLN